MKVGKRINNLRRRLMRNITKNIGGSYKVPVIDKKVPYIVEKVLIIRPNHRLGNQLLLTPLVQEVINTFPNCKIDLFVKGGVAFPVFENYDHVITIYQLPKKPFSNLYKYFRTWANIKKKRYDLVINGDKNSSSGRLLTQLSKSTLKIFGENYEELSARYEDYKHISKYPVYNLRHYLTKLGYPENKSNLPVLDIKLTEAEIANGKKLLLNITKNSKKTICIYTNATGEKCYSEAWWEAFYNRLLLEFPQYNIIEMLPIENISKINFKAPNFYSKDIREMGAIINNTSIFIAADNGVMHLASASLTPTIGFFSVTNLEVYAPYGNGSMAFRTNESNIDDWIQAIRANLISD